MENIRKHDHVTHIGSVEDTPTAAEYPKSCAPSDASPFGWFKFVDMGDEFRIVQHSSNMPVHLGMTEQQGDISLVGKNMLQYLPWSEAELYCTSVRNLELFGAPLAIRHHVVQADGTAPVIFECVFKDKREDGSDVFVSTYENISARTVAPQEKSEVPTGYHYSGEKECRVAVRTFGYFEFFVDGQAILFPNPKVKELLALIIDRRGGFISSEEAITLLWEDELIDSALQTKYRKTKMMLMRTLEKYNVQDILEKGPESARVIPGKVRCDLYDYISGNPKFDFLFTDTYMANYSWGEMTLALLENKKNSL